MFHSDPRSSGDDLMLTFEGIEFESEEGWRPSPLESVRDTGLNYGLLSDLALKIMYFRGLVTGAEIAQEMCLPFQPVVRPLLDFLKREQMCEVRGSTSVSAGTYEYVLSTKGMSRAREQLDLSAYVGPAPVTWQQYTAAIRAQGRRKLQVTPEMMQQALVHLVLEPEVFHKIGPAVNSGRSVFLYGPPGNGKTTIADSVGRLVIGHDMYLPYCVEVDGQIIKLYDEINHVRLPEEETNGGFWDRRWIRVQRPVITVGGELTLAGLDLVYDQNVHYYEAPFQMKANGGMFIIDDFGRQQVRPRDLLNRWIVPMEKNVDYLAMRTGRKIEVPFSVLLVFATNLPPADLVDEAFLRRIRHKIHITSPTFDGYREIFRRVCEERDIPHDEEALKYLLQEYYIKANRKLRANHPRDLVEQIIDICTYRGREPVLEKELIDQAADAYFVEL
jgi:predicted ATPase with chaperone activity